MSTRPCALMTAYAQGSIISRELREMLAEEAASERFEHELRVMDAERGVDMDSTDYGDWMHEKLVAEGAL